jgi:thiol-disulfide isomerase/thioredoxin
MKLIRLALLLLVSLTAAGSVGATDRPMAVWFYADWCTNCKLIAPKIAQVQPEFEKSVDFVKLDVTNEETKAATRTRARELGILPLYMGNRATGWLALVDAQGKQVGELRHFMSVEDMRAALGKLTGTEAPAAAPVPAPG